jgi:hypothetical protein
MGKKQIIIDPDKPLPTELSKEYWETFAKLILENYYPDKFFNLSVDNEKPDLRNEDANIGIEVTSVENKESREIDSLYSGPYFHGDEIQKEKALRQIEKLGGKVEKYFLMHPVRNRDLNKIYTAVKLKTHKLNNNYKVFKKNYLLIFDTNLIVDQELSEMLKNITENSIENVSFDAVFLYCFGGDLYEFNISKNTYKHFEKSDRIVQQLAIDTRQIIIDKHRNN